MQRNINLDWIAVLVLRLAKAHATISDMLLPEPHSIFPASARVEQEIKSQEQKPGQDSNSA